MEVRPPKIMLPYIYFLIVLALVLIVIGISGYKRPVNIPSPAGPVLTTSKYRLALSLTALLDKTIPFTAKLLDRLKWDEKIKQRLGAGRLRLSPSQFFNLKILAVMLMAGAGFLLLNRPEPIVLLIACVSGFFLPDLWLFKRINQRKHQIVRVLPETVDLLSLCVEAGLDFIASIRWIIEKKLFINPMIEELAFVAEEVSWGKPRLVALKDMAVRLNISPVSSFIQTLVQAERMGTPVVEALSILSDDLRLQRFRQGERLALQGPIKILVPLVFCILPVIAIIVAGPIFLQFMQGNILGGLK